MHTELDDDGLCNNCNDDPTGDRNNQDQIDAERYRALMKSARITVMGWAGFERHDGTPADANGYRHITVNFWTLQDKEKVMDNDDQAKHGRELFTKYIDQCVINEQVKDAKHAQAN